MFIVNVILARLTWPTFYHCLIAVTDYGMRDNERWRPISRLPHKKLQDFTDFAIINWPPYIAYYNEKALSDHTSMESMQLYSGQMICVPLDENFTLGMVFF